MAMKGDITIQVGSLAEFMEHISAYEKDTTGRACVTVMDVYCPTWGSCNALKSTFKDLVIQEVDDQVVSIKFLQVNAEAVLDDLKKRGSSDPPLTPRSMKRPLELQRDLLPNSWKERLQNQIGKAKPLWIFYKDCQFVNSIEGVVTPYIKRTIKQLIKEKKPASEYITNAALLEQWSSEFGALESEVAWSKFQKAINIWCLFPPTAPPLNDDESKALMGALNCEKGSMPMVTAKGLQEFVGDEKFDAKFHQTVPGYEERVKEDRQKAAENEAKKEEAPPPAPEPEPEKEEEKEPEPAFPDFLNGATHNGSDGSKQLGSAAEVAMGAFPFTVALWVQAAEGAGEVERANNDMGILSCGPLGVSLRGMQLFVSYDPARGDDKELTLVCPEKFTEGAWHHVCIHFSEWSVRVVIDGTASAQKEMKFADDARLDADHPVALGSLMVDGGNTMWEGSLCRLAIVASDDQEMPQEHFKHKPEGKLAKDGEAKAAEEAPAAEKEAAPAEEPTSPASEPYDDGAGDAEGGSEPPAEDSEPPADAKAEEPAAEGEAAPEEAPEAPAEEPAAEAPEEGGEADAPADPKAEGGEEAPAPAEEAPADPPAE
eukprot:TRINITY_DN4575_c0_g3_i1.p1 TRINITY_DN4575_c0_g3~~TRINITY_DN4575_c0_g3_i1.p1  ORF type:complete len:599 (+),score=243.44 TRINITY_DN4575_c0_g3_i1:113-1909(+)